MTPRPLCRPSDGDALVKVARHGDLCRALATQSAFGDRRFHEAMRSGLLVSGVVLVASVRERVAGETAATTASGEKVGGETATADPFVLMLVFAIVLLAFLFVQPVGERECGEAAAATTSGEEIGGDEVATIDVFVFILILVIAFVLVDLVLVQPMRKRKRSEPAAAASSCKKIGTDEPTAARALILVFVVVLLLVFVPVAVGEGKAHQATAAMSADEIQSFRKMAFVDALIVVVVVLALTHPVRQREAGKLPTPTPARHESCGKSFSFAASLEFSVECFLRHGFSFSRVDSLQFQFVLVCASGGRVRA